MGRYRRVTLMEREELSRMLAAGYSLRATAQAMRRAPSTVARSLDIGTGKGVHFGDSMEKVLHLYGAATQQFSVGPLVRLRYYSERKRGRYYEWSLVFRKDRLVEWAAYSYE